MINSIQSGQYITVVIMATDDEYTYPVLFIYMKKKQKNKHKKELSTHTHTRKNKRETVKNVITHSPESLRIYVPVIR